MDEKDQLIRYVDKEFAKIIANVVQRATPAERLMTKPYLIKYIDAKSIQIPTLPLPGVRRTYADRSIQARAFEDRLKKYYISEEHINFAMRENLGIEYARSMMLDEGTGFGKTRQALLKMTTFNYLREKLGLRNYTMPYFTPAYGLVDQALNDADAMFLPTMPNVVRDIIERVPTENDASNLSEKDVTKIISEVAKEMGVCGS